MNTTHRKRLAVAAVLAWGAVMAFALWCLVPPYRGRLDEFSVATKILDHRGRVLRVVLDRNDALSDPIPLERSGDWAVSALVAAEDKRFFRHHGVDCLAVCRAAWRNAVRGRVVSGASTISMLVGKLTEPRPRTLWTKIVEASHARQIEKRFTKAQIVEQYLNRAPFGSNLVGLEAAARRYFGKSAADLTLAETALLVGLPQSPSRLRPDLHAGRAADRRNYVLARMRACGFITDAQFRDAVAQEVATARAPMPFRAPHFCDMVTGQYPHRAALTTSLDLDIQSAAEQALRSGLRNLRSGDVRGGAVVVLDVREGVVRAMVGSPDYSGRADCGQVNAVLARRSPGSALKPFVYAMAIDEGMCSPRTIVADIPVDFSGYRPRNFDRDFCGPVPVRDALVQSLNIPAFLYVQKLGLQSVVLRLRELGLSTLERPAEHYGLAIAVGTCEVTLLDLANAYACLARLGIYREVGCLEREAAGPGVRLFSAEAAYLVADMLSGDERALDAVGHIGDVSLPRIAWKTGTSSGQRDAWCIAYNPEYVVGVWIGNPAGRASPALIGAAAAAPVVHAMFRRFYPDGRAPWFERPPGLATREVCRISGQIPTACCADTVVEDYIAGLTSGSPCAVHRCEPTGEGGAGAAPAREVWPPDVEAFLVARGLKAGRARDGAASAPVDAGIPVRIVTPAQGATFHLIADAPQFDQCIALRATAGETAPELHWFVDRQLYAQTRDGAPVLWPLRKGKHAIRCCDRAGRSAAVDIVVE